MSASLFVAALSAPLVAVDPSEPKVLHAATSKAVVAAWPLPKATPVVPLTAACGEDNLKLLEVGDDLVPFPPRVKGLPEGWTRCRECHAATGRRSPRCDLTEASA